MGVDHGGGTTGQASPRITARSTPMRCITSMTKRRK